MIDQGGDAAALASTLQRVGLSARLQTVRGNKLHSLAHTFVVVAAAGELHVLLAGAPAERCCCPALRVLLMEALLHRLAHTFVVVAAAGAYQPACTAAAASSASYCR